MCQFLEQPLAVFSIACALTRPACEAVRAGCDWFCSAVRRRAGAAQRRAAGQRRGHGAARHAKHGAAAHRGRLAAGTGVRQGEIVQWLCYLSNKRLSRLAVTTSPRPSSTQLARAHAKARTRWLGTPCSGSRGPPKRAPWPATRVILSQDAKVLERAPQLREVANTERERVARLEAERPSPAEQPPSEPQKQQQQGPPGASASSSDSGPMGSLPGAVARPDAAEIQPASDAAPASSSSAVRPDLPC